MFRKLQWQLTGIFTLILTVILVVANVTVYLLLEKTNEQRLASEIEEVLKTIESTSWVNGDGSILTDEDALQMERGPLEDKTLSESIILTQTTDQDSQVKSNQEDHEETEDAESGEYVDSEDSDLTETEAAEKVADQNDNSGNGSTNQGSSDDEKALEDAANENVVKSSVDNQSDDSEASADNQSDDSKEVPDNQSDDSVEAKDEGVEIPVTEADLAKLAEEKGLGNLELVIPYSVAGFPYYAIKDLNHKTISQNAVDETIMPYMEAYEQKIADMTEPLLIDLTQDGRGYYLLVKEPILFENQAYGYVVVAENITLAFDTLEQLQRIMMISMAVEVMVAFFLSYFLAGRFIKPVKESYLMKEQFIGDASHELRTPLSIMGLSIDYLGTEKDALSMEGRETLRDMKEETGRMSRLVERLLLMARHDGHTLLMASEMVDLSDLIRQELASRKIFLDQNDLELSVNLPSKMFSIGDPQLLSMVVATLIDNGIKYNTKGGYIKIQGQVQQEKHKVINTLVFENSCMEVIPKEVDRFFERFYTRDVARNKEKSGYGLGLALAKNIIESHHGEIYAASKDEKTFQIHIKLTSNI